MLNRLNCLYGAKRRTDIQSRHCHAWGGPTRRKGHTMESIPSASYSLTLRVEFPHETGALGKILTVMGEAGGLVGAVHILRMSQHRTVRDITLNARDSEHGQQ